MAFFKSFQQNLSLPSMSSIVDTLSSAVDGLTSVVEEVSYSVADTVTEQVTSMMQGLRAGEEENLTASEEKAPSIKEEQPVSQDASKENNGKNMHSTAVDINADCSNTLNSDKPYHRSSDPRREKKQKKNAPAEHSSDVDNLKGCNSSTQPQEAGSFSDSNSNIRSDALKDKRGRPHRSEEMKDQDVRTNQTKNGNSFNNINECGQKSSGLTEKREKSKNMPHKTTDHKSRDQDTRSHKTPNHVKDQVAKKVRQRSPRNNKDLNEPLPSGAVNSLEEKANDVRKHRLQSSKMMDNDHVDVKSTQSKKPKNHSKDQYICLFQIGRDLHGSSSESEDEVLGKYHRAMTRLHGTRPSSDRQQNYMWETRQKYSPLSAEYDGYSSEVSADEANCIQRMRRTPPLDELQPPPYQDDSGSPHFSCTPSEIGDSKCELSHCSNSPRYSYNKCPSEGSTGHEIESFQNKGYEEDVPSDSTAVLSPEDMSARGSSSQLPKSFDPEPAAKYGTLDVTFDYDSQEQKLLVTATAVTDLPTHNRTGNSSSWQVHIVLLPMKKQRAKTGIQRGPCPIFTETLKFNHIESEMIGNYAVRFRLYLVRRMKKERIVGEKIFYLTKLNLQGKLSVPVVLEPAYSLSGCDSQMSMSEMSCTESTSSCQSLVHGSAPEILIGLLYNATTGRLSAEVIKGSHFKNLSSNRPPNTYVKLTLLNSMGQEMSKCKTSIRRGQPNPLYKETFIFQVALFQLSDVTLILSVYNKRSMKRKEMIGWISLGLNSSGDEELNHWTEMKESKGQQVCRWHTLLES
ncbi:hypothetical protein FKM82_010255 [Ascaphus truei]